MALELAHELRAGYALFRRAVQRRLQYAIWFLLDLLGFAMIFGLTLLLWRYVSRENALAMEWSTLRTYLVLAFGVNFIMGMGLENAFGQAVRSGTVAVDLLKPVNFQWMQFCHAAADLAVQVVIAAGILMLAALFLKPSPLPTDIPRLCAFLLSLGLACMLQFSVVFVFAQAAFVTQFSYGLYYTRLMLHQALSGLFAPLILFPDWLRQWAGYLPFKGIVETPVRIGLGWAPWSEVPGLLLSQAAWILGLSFLGHRIFKAMLARIEIQGG